MTGFGMSKGGGQRPRALGQRPKAERLQVLLRVSATLKDIEDIYRENIHGRTVLHC